MAIFSTDFTGVDGQNPPGWTNRTDISPQTGVEEVPGSAWGVGGVHSRYENYGGNPLSAWRGLSWDAPGTIAGGGQTIELLMQVGFQGSAIIYPYMLLAPDAVGITFGSGYGPQISPDTGSGGDCQIRSWSNGGIAGTVGTPVTGSADVALASGRMWIRHRINTATGDHEMTFWRGDSGAGEPGTPQITGNNASFTTGLVGIGHNSFSEDTDWGYLAIATDGEVLPVPGAGIAIQEVATGTPTDTELQNSQVQVIDGNGGTYWARVYPAAVTPNHDDIKNGTGGPVGNPETGAVTSDSETLTLNFTGLAENTSYQRWATAEDSGGQPTTPTSAAFSTLQAAVAVRFLLRDVATGIPIPAGRTVSYSLWTENGGTPDTAPPAGFGNQTVVTTNPGTGYNVEIIVTGEWVENDILTLIVREIIAGGSPPGANDNWSSGALVVAEPVFI